MKTCPDCDSPMIYAGAEVEQDETGEILVDVYECPNCHVQITWGPIDRSLEKWFNDAPLP